MMKMVLVGCVAMGVGMGVALGAPGDESSAPAKPVATAPATAPAAAKEVLVKNSEGEIELNFESAETAKEMESYVEKGVTFKLAWAPQNSRAKGRIMFF